MKAVKKAAKVITEIENWLVILTFVAMIVVVMAIVLCRYVFNISFTSGEEIARYLMICCGYGGAALGFREHAHVGVEVFAGWFPKKWKPTILKLRHILSTIVVAFLFVFACMCFNQFASSGKLTTATRIPTAIVYIIIPISLILSIIHTIVDIKEDFKPSKDKKEVA